MAVRVDEVVLAKSQRCYNVTLSGKKYLGSLDCGLNAALGQWIEAEIKPNNRPDMPAWLGKWTFVSAAPAAPMPPMAAPAVPAQPAVQSPRIETTRTPEPQYAVPNTNVAPWWMPFASNTVAHAIQAGKIQSPEQIRPWLIAAKLAAVSHDNDVPF